MALAMYHWISVVYRYVKRFADYWKSYFSSQNKTKYATYLMNARPKTRV
jgi:hypothetical protein